MKPTEFTGTVVAKVNVYIDMDHGEITHVMIGQEGDDFAYHHLLGAARNGVPASLRRYLDEPKREWPAWEFGT